MPEADPWPDPRLGHRRRDGSHPSQLLGTLFDGIARHTEEAYRWVESIEKRGFREVIAERDAPFGDYGAGPRKK